MVAWFLLLTCTVATADESVSFRSDIAPILLEHCVSCHGAKNAEGGYRLDAFAELAEPGDTGASPLASEDDPTGELLRRLTATDESERMPAESEPLSEDEVANIKSWIESGAKFDGDDPDQPLAFVIPAPRHPSPPDSYPASIPVSALAFSPDGSSVLVGGYHELTVWDASTGKLMRRIQNIGQRVYAVAFNGDASLIAVACGTPGRRGEVRLVDFASGEVKAVVARSTDVALDLSFRPDSDQLAVASADQLIRIVDTKTLELVRSLASHADWVTAVAWSDDGSKLASASRDKSAKVFDAETGQLLSNYQGHSAVVRGVSMLPDGKHVVSVGADNKYHHWTIDRARKVAAVDLGGEGYRIIRGQGWALIPCSDSRLLKIDLKKNRVSQEFKGHTDWVLSAALDASQTQFASGAFDGQVRVWNLEGDSLQTWLAKP